MNYIYEKCSANGGKCLLTVGDIITNLYSKVDLTEEVVEDIMQNLVFDNYIEKDYGTKINHIKLRSNFI